MHLAFDQKLTGVHGYVRGTFPYYVTPFLPTLFLKGSGLFISFTFLIKLYYPQVRASSPAPVQTEVPVLKAKEYSNGVVRNGYSNGVGNGVRARTVLPASN